MVKIITGPPRSGKARTAIHSILPAIRKNRCSEILVLVPSNLKAEEIREALLAREGVSGFLGLRILTFLDLTLAAFQDSRLPGRVNTPLARNWMIQTILANLRLQVLKEVRETLGFVDLTADFIRTLKEGGVTPKEFHQNILAAGAAPKLLEISEIYQTYEDRRRKRNLLDREDLFDLAVRELDRNPDSPLSGLRSIIVTGFYDFTPLQLRLLASLSRLPEMHALTLTLVHAAGRGPAGRFTRRTLDRLLSVFPGAEIKPLDPEENQQEDPLPHLSRHLFTHPETTRRIPSHNAVRILQAPGTYSETEEIARTIRSLMEEKDYHFKDFALVFRNLKDYQGKVREIFRFYEIPHHLTSGLSLGRNPLVQAVMGMLEVSRSGFRRDAVVRLVRSHYILFGPLCRSRISSERIDILSREAMIHGGKEEWETRIRSRIQVLDDRLKRLESGLAESREVQKSGEKIKELREKIDDYQECARIIHDLFSTLSSFPLRADLAGFVEALDKMMGTFQMEKQIYASEDLRLICRDQAALRKFQELLNQIVQDHESVHSGQEISLSEFLRILQVTLSDAGFSPDPPREDAVLVTDVLGMRDLHRPVVFIGGLVEESFPRTHPPNPIFGEQERMRLNRALGPDRWVPPAVHWREEEEILFLLSAAAATEILFLTYPRTDAQGRDLLASRYIDRVRSLFDEGSIEEISVPLKDPLPDRDRIFRNKELIEYTFRALHRPLSQERRALALYHQLLRSEEEKVLSVLHGLRVNQARDRGDGAYTGLIGPDAAARLRQEEEPFSATALESYGICPFKYFCEQELKIQPVEEVEDEMGAPDIGSLYHKILERFYKETGGPVTEENLKERRTLMHEIIDRELSKAEYRGVPGHKKIWEIRKLEVHQILDRFLEQEAEEFKESGETPAHFEACFGMVPSAYSDPLSTEDPLTLSSESGPIRLMGKVDRIDISEVEGQPSFSIVDYKSGKYAATAKQIQEGESLQLPVYAEWARNAMSHTRELRRGCFYLLKKGERKCQIPDKKHSREDFWETSQEYIRKYVSSIRQGEFPMTQKKCPDYCRYSSLCRIREE